MVMVAQHQISPVTPMLPRGLIANATQQALTGHHHQTSHKLQRVVQVNL
jgi:hypothetical protein